MLRNNLLTLFVMCLIPAFMHGCANNANLLRPSSASLPIILGHADLSVSTISPSELTFPNVLRQSSGKALVFSPIEFRSETSGNNIEGVTLPLGRFVAIRHSGEGLLNQVKMGDAKSFMLSYFARYDTMKQAKQDFPKLPDSQFKTQMVDGKTMIMVEHWRMRMSMLFDKNRNAFRVLLDQIEYHAPVTPQTDSEEVATQTVPIEIPVIVAFSYRHPNQERETLVQQNVLFEFHLTTDNDHFKGKPQISGWLPLHKGADVDPYTIGITVAELVGPQEDVIGNIKEFVKKVREWM